MALEKACFRIIDDCSVGSIKLRRDEKIYVQFNPEKYSISTEVNYGFNRKDGVLCAQYGGADSRKLSVEFFYDMLSEKGVFRSSSSITADSIAGDGVNEFGGEFPEAEAVNTAYVNKIVAMTRPGKEKSAPPLVEFIWGNESIKGVIVSLSLQYVLFNQKGDPIRAKIQLTLKECDDVQQSSGSATQGLQVPSASLSFKKSSGLEEDPSDYEVKSALVKAIKLL